MLIFLDFLRFWYSTAHPCRDAGALRGPTQSQEANGLLALKTSVLAQLRVNIAIRFNILAPERTAFNAEGLGVSEQIARVFSHARMSRKLWSFAHVLLPSLASQTSSAFELYVFYSKYTPGNWTAVFEAIVASYAFAHLVPIQNFKEAWTSLQSRCIPDVPFITTRLDDDDGLAPTFVERLRGHALIAWIAEKPRKDVIVERLLLWLS
jgi:hypothetical protein